MKSKRKTRAKRIAVKISEYALAILTIIVVLFATIAITAWVGNGTS